MCLDEAQHLGRTEFEWLRDVHDELDEGGVNLVLIFVGQPALQAKKSLFQRDGEEQIVGRFMTHELRFAGISSANDCATCLQGYDLQEYEADSGWPHTRFLRLSAAKDNRKNRVCGQPESASYSCKS